MENTITPEEYEKLTGKALPQQMYDFLDKEHRKKPTVNQEPRYMVALEHFEAGRGLSRLEATCTEAARERTRTYLARINEKNGWRATIHERRVI